MFTPQKSLRSLVNMHPPFYYTNPIRDTQALQSGSWTRPLNLEYTPYEAKLMGAICVAHGYLTSASRWSKGIYSS